MQPNIKFHNFHSAADRKSITGRVLSLIDDIFTHPADTDYVSARFFYLTQCNRAFFWPALQCLEKYLKANLLHYGASAKGYSHNLGKLANELDNHSDVLKNLTLNPDSRHASIFVDVPWGSDKPKVFIDAIHEYGDASNRYNYFGAEIEASYLPKLDQLVYALRSNINPGDRLEGVGNNSSLRYYAYQENIPFAPSDFIQESIDGKFFLGSSVPGIELALKGHYGNKDIYEEWLTSNIVIKSDEIARIKTL